MKSNKKDSQPFWEDEQSPQPKFVVSTAKGAVKMLELMNWSMVVGVLLTSIYVAIMFKEFPAVWLCPAYLILIFGFSLYSSRRRRMMASKSKEVQEKAMEITGASVIGSAVHVAGHPELERDQPVVLVLKEDGLQIYNYESSSPIASIDIGAIDKVLTITYDEDRIPHADVVDSTAQALQIEFDLEGKAFICLFRRMKGVRPIDWYHAIHRERF